LPIEVLHVSRRDTIDSIRGRIVRYAPGTQLWLVIPWAMRALATRLGLLRVARAAEDAAVDLTIVSRHTQTRLEAQEIGLRARIATPPNAWGQPATRINATVAHRRPKRERPRFGHRRSLSFGTFLLSLLVIVGLIGALGLSIALLLPSAEITLTPQSRTVQAAGHVTASPVHKATDYGQAIIPARLVQVIIDGIGDTPATEGIDISDEHASGEIVFANRTDEPVTVPKGTIVRTSSGVNARFYTVSDVELPAVIYGHARVGIIAVEPGISGNVKPFTINMVESEVADKVDVLNDKATEGGTTRRMPIVAFEDFDRLRAEMIAKLQDEAYDQLVAELDKDEFIPPESLDVQVMAQHFHQVVDQQSDVLSMDMKVVARGLAVDGSALNDLASELLQAGQEDVALIPDSLQVTRSEPVEITGANAVFDMQAEGAVAPTIDQAAVREAIRGKQAGDAIAWLDDNLALSGAPQYEITPPIWNRMPWLPARIELVISVGD